MSSAAHSGDDDIAFFAADIGETRTLLATAAANTQLPDATGALQPGRWLVQIAGVVSGATVWVGFGPFGTVLPNPVGAGQQRIPMVSIVAVEVNVRKGYNDQVVVRTSTGTATVHLTRISRNSTTRR